MPFHMPYRNYAPGDLFYGLGWRRAALMQQLTQATGMPSGDRLGWIDLFLFPINQYQAPEAIQLNTSFAETLTNHPKYNRALDGDHVGIEGNAEWRAKSKGGLLWATTVANKHVHFCLDGLVMDQVVGKSYPGRLGTGVGRDSPPGTPAHEKERSITGSELRWLYRWRRNPQVSSLIQFWRYDSFHKKWVQCSPPWEWHNSVWATYNPTTEWHP
ncbi:hypothetical protein [Duganella hordei]|uniref:hypothetical protein n=1 Tax=Duganella hordei TaxID=2865934 RepID=UPI0030E7CE63